MKEKINFGRVKSSINLSREIKKEAQDQNLFMRGMRGRQFESVARGIDAQSQDLLFAD